MQACKHAHAAGELAGERAGPLGGIRRRLPVSHLAAATIDILAGLADWGHKQRQLGAARVSAAKLKAAQSKPAAGSMLDEEVEVVEAEEDREEDLHKACMEVIEVEGAE